MDTSRPSLAGIAVGTALSLLGLGLGIGVPDAPAIALAPQHGRVSPAVAAHPLLRRVGRATGSEVTFTCQTTVPAGCYGPRQIRAAYGIDKVLARGIEGQGQTIVIVDAFQAPAIRSDLALFDKTFGLPDAHLKIRAPQGLTRFDQSDANQVGWSAEISLDVEWAHAIAPKAKIELVLAKSNDDGDIQNALEYVARKRLGTVVSQSYGEAEQCSGVPLSRQHAVFRRMVANGTTVLASSGDEGAAEPTCDGRSWIKAASSPASDPLVTAIGGTDLIADGRTGAYRSETVWNEPQYAGAGGSGLSKVYAEPGYQQGVQHTGRRSVPDVSYNASVDHSVLVVWSTSGLGADQVFRIGGTSSGSPQWAGLVALSAQLAHHRLGDINPALYALGGSPASGALFHDITSGNTSVVEQDANGADVAISGVSARSGWDPAVGFGSPHADTLVGALAAATRL